MQVGNTGLEVPMLPINHHEKVFQANTIVWVPLLLVVGWCLLTTGLSFGLANHSSWSDWPRMQLWGFGHLLMIGWSVAMLIFVLYAMWIMPRVIRFKPDSVDIIRVLGGRLLLYPEDITKIDSSGGGMRIRHRGGRFYLYPTYFADDDYEPLIACFCEFATHAEIEE